MFENRKLIIATKHQKEQVIAPIVSKELGITCITDNTFNTDVFGTFTGEIERTTDPIATARQKCLTAMQQNNCTLGIASEGSFGPHPTLFFVNADDEFLIFIDSKRKLEIVVREISTDTNFNGKEITTEAELLQFANTAGFPQHALILSNAKNNYATIHKGITNSKELISCFNKVQQTHQTVYVQTDMRAMYNPTRMKVIEQATVKLVKKIQSVCPICKTPGFGITEIKKGLACSLCGLPTNDIISHLYVCTHCNHTQENMYPNKKTTANPLHCNYCNP